MAELSTQGLDGLIDDMTALMELPDETVLEMLTAEAEVVAAAQQSEAQSMGITKGTRVSIIAEGPDEEEAVKALTEMLVKEIF